METIVIVGAGFGGLYMALYLEKKLKNKKIILFNKTNYFLFTPLLHEVATGAQNRHNVVLEIRNIIKNKNITFCAAEIEKINFNEKEIFFNDSKMKYDKLVISIGSKASMIHIKGSAKYALPLKNIHDAVEIRNKVIKSLEKASISKSEQEIKKLLTFVIMGAGPTGVELAGELSEFLAQVVPTYKTIPKKLVKICLVQRGPKIIPQFGYQKGIGHVMKQLEKKNINVLVNSPIKEVFEDHVLINDNIRINTYNVFWTAGVVPNQIKTTPKLTDNGGFYRVNEFLEAQGTKNVYVMGDCALNFNPGNDKPNPALAQLAVKQAKHLANNLYLEENNKKKLPFIFNPEGFLVSVGSWWAMAQVKNKVFKGKIAWWLWRTIYLSKVIGKRNTLRVGFEWFFLLFSKRDTSEI